MPITNFLTPGQLIVMRFLRDGPRPTAMCQDALAVGTLLRMKLIAWKGRARAGANYLRMLPETFVLTAAGVRALDEIDAGAVPAPA